MVSVLTRSSHLTGGVYGVCLSALVPKTGLRLSRSVRGSVGSTPRAAHYFCRRPIPLGRGRWLYTIYESLHVLRRVVD
jgi:hypothetical protein